MHMSDRRPRLTPAIADVRRAVRETLVAQFPVAAREVAESAADHADPRQIVRPGAGAARPAVLVALSGGPDSLALAAATAFEAPRAGLRAGAVIVDHGLQEGSDAVAARAAEQARALGLDPVLVTRVTIPSPPIRPAAPASSVGGSESAEQASSAGGSESAEQASSAGGSESAEHAPTRSERVAPSPSQAASPAGGPEAAARAARYGAIDAALAETGARAVLLGHTLDDQAETVLLGLARGAGAASLSGMAVVTPPPGADEHGHGHGPASAADGPPPGSRLRPLLGIRRSITLAFCADSGLEPWHDPHNESDEYTRVRVRRSVLPLLEAELGPGVAEALARTAEQLREDDETLHDIAVETIEDLVEHAEAGIAVSVGALAANPPALRNRVIRYVVASEFGVSLSRAQTLAVAELVTAWAGQKGVDLPGIRVVRQGARLVFQRAGQGE